MKCIYNVDGVKNIVGAWKGREEVASDLTSQDHVRQRELVVGIPVLSPVGRPSSTLDSGVVAAASPVTVNNFMQ